MEEVLSLDDAVLDDVYQYWAPPSESEIRIPPLIFARLKQEMADFIMNRKGDDMTVMGLYHKQFTEVIIQRYLSSSQIRGEIHSNLAEFFLGDWHNQPKPASLKIFGGRLQPLARKVTAQPLRFGDPSGGRYNLRKLNELPYHLVLAKKFDCAKHEIFANLLWLQTKIEACSIAAVLADFDAYLRELNGSPDPEVLAVKQCIRLCKSTLEFPDNENCLAVELLGRMEILAQNSKTLRTLLNQAHQWCVESCTEKTMLIPENQCFMAPSGTLVTTLTGHSQGLVAIACTEDRKIMVTSSKDKSIRIWDLDSDSVVHIIEQQSVDCSGVTEQLVICNIQDRLMVVDKLGSLSIYDLKAGNILYKVEPKNLHNSKNLEELRILKNSKHVGTESSRPPTRDTLNQTTNTTTFCFVFDGIFVGAKDRDIFIVDISEEPRLLKRIQTDLNINFGRAQESTVLFGLGANSILSLQPNDIAYNVVTYRNISEILGSYVIWSGLVSVVNFGDGKSGIIMDSLSPGRKNKEPVTIFHERPAKFCDFLNDGTVAVVGSDRISVAELLSRKESKKGGPRKLKQIFSTIVSVHNKNNTSKSAATLGHFSSTTICFARLIMLPASNDRILAVGCKDETVRIYDIKTKKICSLLSGLWGQPTVIFVSGPYLFTSAATVPFVKVWDLGLKSDHKETPIFVENFCLAPTCCGPPDFLLCSLMADDTGVCLANRDGIQKRRKIPADCKIGGLLCLISRETLIFSDSSGKIYETNIKSAAKRLHLKVIAALPSPVRKFSYCIPRKAMALLLENHDIIKLNLSSSYATENIPLLNSMEKRKISDLCLTEEGLILFSKNDQAFMQSYSGKILLNFDWPAENCLNFCTKLNFFACLLTSTNSKDLRNIEIWNLSNGSRSCTIDARDLPVTCLEITNDARFLLVGMGKGSTDQSALAASVQRQIRIYNMVDGTIERRKLYLYSTISAIYAFDENYIGVLMDLGYFGLFKLKIGQKSGKKTEIISNKHKLRRNSRVIYQSNSSLQNGMESSKAQDNKSTACSVL